jgi:chromosome segregation ATPase
MSDLTDRLLARTYLEAQKDESAAGYHYESVPNPLCAEAAAEIERLTKERDDAQERFEDMRDVVYDEANVERDKLRSEAATHAQEIERRDAEIASLRAALTQLLCELDEGYGSPCKESTIAAARAALERKP